MTMQRPRFTGSQAIAAAIFLIAAAWIGSGLLKAEPETDETAAAVAAAEAASSALRELPQVRVRRQSAQNIIAEIVVTGQTQPDRHVTLKAETEGSVAEIARERGDRVDAGDLIVALDMADRGAQLTRAEALRDQREIEFNAAQKLRSRDFASDVTLATARAALEEARANLAAIRTDIGHTRIAAPIDGLLENRFVESGDYVGVGDPIAEIVDLHPIKLVAEVAERQIGNIAQGAVGSARLITGKTLEGTVTFISATANPVTRTYRVELSAPNPGFDIAAGLTAEIRLPLQSIRAQRISPALLTLNEDGALGVKTVDENDRVAFFPIEIVRDDPEGMWVVGLPDDARLITAGQEFVSAGQVVRPVSESAIASGKPPRPGAVLPAN